MAACCWRNGVVFVVMLLLFFIWCRGSPVVRPKFFPYGKYCARMKFACCGIMWFRRHFWNRFGILLAQFGHDCRYMGSSAVGLEVMWFWSTFWCNRPTQDHKGSCKMGGGQRGRPYKIIKKPETNITSTSASVPKGTASRYKVPFRTPHCIHRIQPIDPKISTLH